MSGTVLPKLNFHEMPQAGLPKPHSADSSSNKSDKGTLEPQKPQNNEAAKTDDEIDKVKKDRENGSSSNSKDKERAKTPPARIKKSVGNLRRLPPLPSPRSMTVRLAKYQSYKMFRPSYAFGFTAAHQLAMTQTYGSHHHRGGLDFYTLARGTERSYSCTFLVNLDPDLLSLCSREDASTLDLARDALISHTRRIFKFITMKSGREINQVRKTIIQN